MPTQSIGDHPQGIVPDRVAEGVVDVLESVEVEEEERPRFGELVHPDQLDVQLLPVEQPGERVVCRAVGEGFLEPLLVGDIDHHADHAVA